MLQSIQLGQNSGLQVSRLCLGTMNFGEPGRGHQGDWTIGPDDARPIFKAAIERGLYYFDCADVYGIGAFTRHKHWGCTGSLVIDARIKPHHAPPLVEDPQVTKKVDALAARGGPLAKYL